MDKKQIRTIQGDTLDQIAARHAGSTQSNLIEQILILNPQIARNPTAVFDAGVKINLPKTQNSSAIKIKKTQKLWD